VSWVLLLCAPCRFAISSTTGAISLAAALDFEALPAGDKMYALLVRVQDSLGLTGFCTATFTVTNVNEAPTVTSYTLSLLENSPVGSINGQVLLPIAADDEDGENVAFAIVSGNTGNVFRFGTRFSSGTFLDRVYLEVNTATIDFETLNRYTLVCSATDAASASRTFTLTVNILNVNEAPVPGASSRSFNVAENSAVNTVVGSLTATDVDAGTTLAWSITTPGNSAGMFGLSAGGVITVVTPPNVEAVALHTFTATVSDGALSATTSVSITVTDVNEAPVFTAGTSYVATVAENAVVNSDLLQGGVRRDICTSDEETGQVTSFSLSGAAASSFQVSVSGGSGAYCARITTNAVLNFEATLAPLLVNVSACDNGAGPRCAVALVSVDVTDVNEAPTLAPITIGADENTVGDLNIGPPIVAVDVDAGDTVTFTQLNLTTFFTLTTVSNKVAQLKTRAGQGRLRDVGTPPPFLVGIRVTDAAGLSTVSFANVSLVLGNDPPVIIPAQYTLPESPVAFVAGTVVGRPTAWDRENTTLTGWRIAAGDDTGRFAIAPTTGQITVAARLDFETSRSYVLRVEVTDSPPVSTNALSGWAVVIVNVTNVNEAPVFPVPPAASVPENAPVGTLVGAVLTATDPDAADTQLFSLVPAVHPVFEVTPGGQVRVKAAVLNFEVASLYTLTVRVADAAGLTTDASFSVNVMNVNEAPGLLATSRSLVENSVSNAPIGAPLVVSDVDAGETFLWAIVSGGGPIVIGASSGQLTVVSPFDFEAATTFTLNVSVTDQGGLGLTAFAVVTVNVLDVNEAPVFVAASVLAKSVPENSPVNTVVGSAVAATDVDGGQTLRFSFPAGQDVFAIGLSTGVITVARAVLNFEATSTYVLTVIVTDNGTPALSTTTTVSVLVGDVNEAPVAGFKGLALSVPENSEAGTLIGVLPVSDVDAADLGRLATRFSLATYAVFALNATTGELRVAAPLDFESQSSYSFSAVVNDTGGLTDSGTVTVNVRDVNEAPVLLPQARAVAENSPRNALVGAPILATDVDSGQLLAFSFTAGNADGIFAINPCSGQITVASPVLNFEAVSSYVLTVMVQDDGTPRLNANATMTITILDVNEAPVLLASSFLVAENQPVNTVVGEQLSTDQDVPDNKTFSIVGGSGVGVFAISASGTLTVASAVLDFESKPSYEVHIMVTDKGGLNDTQPYTVAITDVNEAPVVPSQTVTVAENSAELTATSLPVAFTDQDRNAVEFAIVSGGNGTAVFVIDPVSGLISVSSSVLNFEAASVYTLHVQATDNGSPPLAGTGIVTVQLLDVNEAPSAPAAVTLTIPENRPPGTQVGAGALAASDPDSPSYTRLTWAVTATGPSAGSFFTVTSSGVVSLLASPNFESQSSFSFTVTVTDQGGLDASTVVTVEVTNVNEPPVLPEAVSRFIAENQPAGSDVVDQGTGSRLDLCGSDEDVGSTLSYNISSTRGAFVLDGTAACARLQSTAPFNFETNNTVDVLRLSVCDSGSPVLCTTSAPFSIGVLDVNEPPALVFNATVYVNERARPGEAVGPALSAIDPDSLDTLTFELVAGNASLFRVAELVPPVPRVAALVVAPFTNTSWRLVDVTLELAHSVSVRVTDSAGSTSSGTINIVVVDSNDAPVVAPAAFSVPENATAGWEVGTVVAVDADNSRVGEPPQELTFRIGSGDPGGLFAIHPSTGVVTVARARLDFESTPVFDLTIEVIDRPALGSPLSGFAVVTVSLTNVNEAPMLPVQSLAVSEGALVGAVVAPVGSGSAGAIGSDVDAGDVLTYSLRNSTTLFALNNRTGQITVATPGLNFEAVSSYVLLLRVTDAAGLFAEAAVSITVLNENEAPVFLGTTVSVRENEPVNTAIGAALFAADEDRGEVLSWSILSGALGDVAVDPVSGQLLQASAGLDYEAVPQYTLSVLVVDSGGLTATGAVVVRVLNVNDVTVSGFQGVTELSSLGDEAVVLVGTNFGPVDLATPATFAVTYGAGAATEYTARGCARVAGFANTRLQCTTAPGAGAGLRWRVTVLSVGVNDTAVSNTTTAYLPPSVLALSDSARALRTSVRALSCTPPPLNHHPHSC
jgi:hypothetical protein